MDSYTHEHIYTNPVPMSRGSHYGSNYHVFLSRKLCRRVQAFSNIERDNLIILEMSPEVEWYCEQPCNATVFFDGKREKTVFDVYVCYTNGRQEMQEVKYYDELHSETEKGEMDRHQIEIQDLWCRQNGFDHSVRTDKDIYKGSKYIMNLEWLAFKAIRNGISLKDSSIDDETERGLLRYIGSKDKITIGLLFESGRLSTDGMNTLAELFYKGKIRFSNIEEKIINYATEVELCL